MAMALAKPPVMRPDTHGDHPVFSEILEVGEWIVQLLGDVEEKFLAFSGIGHILSCGEMT
jgi:hypothetical protein